MKRNKSKALVLSLIICLVAVASLGTLAWFSAEDEVTNEFKIANSEDDPDKIFSVDVWEDASSEDTPNEEKIQDGITYDRILPGDELFKEVHIENTGYYDQYVRATITISGASVWQDVYGVHVVPLSDFVETNDETAIHTSVAYYDAASDAFVYELYYNDKLEAGKEIVVFDKVKINENLDRFQAAELAGNFNINVVADVVQTENVGADVFEAFKTVGLVKATPISDASDLADALASEEQAYIIVDAAALTNDVLKIDSAVKNKTIDFNGANATIEFTAKATAENVVVSGIVDEDGTAPSITTDAAFTGNLTVTGCSFKDAADTPYGATVLKGGNVTVDNCEFEGTGKSYGIYHSGAYNGDLVVKDSTFKNCGSWAILINSEFNGNLTVDNCTFDTKDGVLKVLSGITGDFTFTNNTMIGVKGHDGKGRILSVSADGTTTIADNTLDGIAWN